MANIQLRLVALVCVVLSGTLFVATAGYAVAQTEENEHWMTDPASGCTVMVTPDIYAPRSQFTFARQPENVLPSSVRDPVIAWDGDCIDGKAHGSGTLKFLEEGIELVELAYSPARGQVMIEGRVKAKRSVIEQAVSLSLTECSPSDWWGGGGSREVRIDVASALDLTSHSVIGAILPRVEQLAWEECPLVKFSRPYRGSVSAVFHQGGVAQVRARSQERDSIHAAEPQTAWPEYSNRLREAMRQEAEAKLQAARDQRVAEERRQREEAAQREREQREAARRRQEEERARELAEQAAQSRQVFATFVARAGVTEWVQGDQLRGNPFVFQEQTIAFRAYFNTMLAEGEALFLVGGGDPVHVSGVPLAEFTTTGAPVLLAAQVTGTKEFQMLGTKMPLPALDYVDAYLCESRVCEDALFWVRHAQEDGG